jgi:glycosyltransferase involved in cell wall biosynthesis
MVSAMAQSPTSRAVPDGATAKQGHAPLVTVVIPAYNCGGVIGEALESVFNQDYPALQVLVIDDGSTDDTVEVVANFGPRVSLIRQPNAGAAVARNEGLRRAEGPYVALLDADDVWLPGKLRLQIAHLQRHPDVGLCCTRWRVLYPDASGAYHIEQPVSPASVAVDASCSGWIYGSLLLDCVVWTSTVVMRRDLVRRIGDFDPALRRGQDYDYWLRASRLTRIHRLDAALALYRMESGGSAARRFPRTNWELTVVQRALQRWGPTGPDGQKVTPADLRARLWSLNFSFGYAKLREGRRTEARRAFVAALRERPAHLKTWLYLLLASGPERLVGRRGQAPATS